MVSYARSTYEKSKQFNKKLKELQKTIKPIKAIVPGFSKELLDKVPSLGVYSLFMLFTEEEFDV